jgi:hypothetical protein
MHGRMHGHMHGRMHGHMYGHMHLGWHQSGRALHTMTLCGGNNPG